MQLIKKHPYLCAFAFGVFMLTSLRILLPPTPPPPEVFGEVPGFRLQSHQGTVFGTAELGGKTTIVNFVFTRCGSVCPMLTQKLKQVRDRLEADGVPVTYLSLSVDPEFDTAEKLAEFAGKQDAGGTNWHFLTGPAGDVRRLIIDGFKVGLGESVPGEQADLIEIAHSEKFVLVDGRGQIRGFYSVDQKGLDDLDIRTRIVAREQLAQK